MNEPLRGSAELVVVGVDAAPEGAEPLIFALRESARRGAGLQVVTVVPTPEYWIPTY